MLRITPIKSRIIPTLALTTMMASGVFAANPKVENQNEENTVLTEAVVADNSLSNKVNWDDIALFGVGFAAAAVALGIGKKVGEKNASQKRENGETTSEYFNKRFIKDSDKLYSYMFDELGNIIASDKNVIDKAEFYKKISFFTRRYPSRREYIDMFVRATEDSRLTTVQKDTLCRYLITKAACSSKDDEENAKILFPFLEGINDYNKMVEEIVNRTVSSSDGSANTNNQTAPTEGVKQKSAEEDTELLFDTVHHNLTFKDIGGQDKAIEVLKRTVLYPIKFPNGFKNNSISRGILLYGPEGTGKTLLAETLANESNAKYIKLNGNDLTSKWLGETEKNWRKLFQVAKENQPAIIFIDEFDAIAAKRGQGDTYNDKFVNQILGLISDAEKNNYQIYIIAATNRKELIDKAILRPGRIGREVECIAPQTKEDVKQIFTIHLNRYEHEDNLEEDLFSEELLKQHASGANIADIIYSASENAKERCSIYEKMENDTFQDSDMDGVIITNADIKKAIEDRASKSNRKTKIGFNK